MIAFSCSSQTSAVNPMHFGVGTSSFSLKGKNGWWDMTRRRSGQTWRTVRYTLGGVVLLWISIDGCQFDWFSEYLLFATYLPSCIGYRKREGSMLLISYFTSSTISNLMDVWNLLRDWDDFFEKLLNWLIRNGRWNTCNRRDWIGYN